MNRRSFFKSLAKAAAGFSILPSAMTYKRTWKRGSDLWIPNLEWVRAPYEMQFCVYNVYATNPRRDFVPIIYMRSMGVTTRVLK